MKQIRARRQALVSALLSISAFIAVGCGDDGKTTSTGSSTSSTTSSGSMSPTRLSGQLRYESVPYDITKEGLDYSKIEAHPIRGARVLLLDAANNNILEETISTNEGTYSFGWSGVPNVKIWVYSETTTPAIVVVDNTALNARYVLESAEIVVDQPKTLDLLAGSGWTGMSYGKPRQAAPFSILDAAYAAAKRFLDEGKPAPQFPKLEINWSVDNRPEDGNVNIGQIGTSYWDGAEIFILGKEDVDTDEFDTHVIVHEWGHSFEDNIARSDSPGGSHGFGDVLDPRIAFSEGFCNALSAIILEPNTIYSDSSGVGQKDGFWEDIDENDTSAQANPGWFSESTVQHIVFDLYDGDGNGAEAFDKVALGVPGIYGVMTGNMKTTPAQTTLFPFIAGIKASNAAQTNAIDTLVGYHKSSSAFGIDKITDDWGMNETHNGNDPDAIPVYNALNIGETKIITLIGGLESSMLGQNRFLRFKGNGSSVKVSTSSADDVDLYVYQKHDEVGSSVTTTGNESTQFSTKAGEDYVINVQGFGTASGSYQATVKVTP